MARLDVDTTSIGEAGAHAGRAAEALRAATRTFPDPHHAAGEPHLGAALTGLWEAWGPVHATLVDDLDVLSAALHGTAAVYDDGEEAAAHHLARVLLPRPDSLLDARAV